MTISVTDSDIQNALPGNCSKCVIARALQRTLGRSDIFCSVARGHYDDWLETYVDMGAYAKIGGIGIYDSGRKVVLPNNVAKVMFDFDNGVVPEPFSFNLEIPTELVSI